MGSMSFFNGDRHGVVQRPGFVHDDFEEHLKQAWEALQRAERDDKEEGKEQGEEQGTEQDERQNNRQGRCEGQDDRESEERHEDLHEEPGRKEQSEKQDKERHEKEVEAIEEEPDASGREEDEGDRGAGGAAGAAAKAKEHMRVADLPSQSLFEMMNDKPAKNKKAAAAKAKPLTLFELVQTLVSPENFGERSNFNTNQSDRAGDRLLDKHLVFMRPLADSRDADDTEEFDVAVHFLMTEKFRTSDSAAAMTMMVAADALIARVTEKFEEIDPGSDENEEGVQQRRRHKKAKSAREQRRPSSPSEMVAFAGKYNLLPEPHGEARQGILKKNLEDHNNCSIVPLVARFIGKGPVNYRGNKKSVRSSLVKTFKAVRREHKVTVKKAEIRQQQQAGAKYRLWEDELDESDNNEEDKEEAATAAALALDWLGRCIEMLASKASHWNRRLLDDVDQFNVLFDLLGAFSEHGASLPGAPAAAPVASAESELLEGDADGDMAPPMSPPMSQPRSPPSLSSAPTVPTTPTLLRESEEREQLGSAGDGTILFRDMQCQAPHSDGEGDSVDEGDNLEAGGYLKDLCDVEPRYKSWSDEEEENELEKNGESPQQRMPRRRQLAGWGQDLHRGGSESPVDEMAMYLHQPASPPPRKRKVHTHRTKKRHTHDTHSMHTHTRSLNSHLLTLTGGPTPHSS